MEVGGKGRDDRETDGHELAAEHGEEITVRWDEAAGAYEEALALKGNNVERTFLASRLHDVRAHLTRRT
ncbi:MAG: hypothetical protein M3Y49_10200 [Actinomycetota bacterium]|nr:hypothetical protein [Actinomycetota bacterium]